MTTIDVKNVKAIKNLTNNKEIIKISDPNDPTKIYWQKITDVVVTYTINTGVATITIVGNDGVTYVNAASTSGSVNIPKGITITCSATVETGYNTISNTTKVLDSDYVYSPTTTLKIFTITLSSTYGHWENLSGTTVTSISNVPYGTYISKSGQRISVDGSSYNFVVNSATTQYNYNFDHITIPSSTVSDNMTIIGVATRSTRYYSLTFENSSSNRVTAYFRIGSGSWNSYLVSGGGSTSVSTTYNGSISVYFKYGDATSSTISRSMTSDQSVSGDCSSTNVYDWQWHGDGYHVGNDYGEQSSIGGSAGSAVFYCISGWASSSEGRYVFNRSSNSDRVRIELSNGKVFIAPIPSGMPIYYDDSSDSWSQTWVTVSESPVSGIIGAKLVDEGDEDREMKAYIGVKVSDAGGAYPSSVQYGKYSYDYIRTDYSVWWN